ncbi:BON domain-containing protein [Kineococcus sp. R86509]|uniref:BON domain-containing protein n=1 Tax=Kineococcus sp. R86509 TaxID=3093851 RepID=UPI0036D3C8D3
MANLQTTTDSKLKEAVIDELSWVPDVDSTEIAVAVTGGIVTLLGQVGSYSEKVRAAKAAMRVHGVRAVAQEITVRSPWMITDAEVAAAAETALEASINVPESVRVVVDNRVITLSGETGWQFQRMAAEHAVEHLRGVQRVRNTITLTAVPAPVDMADRIHAAFVRSAELDSKAINLSTTEGGTVTMRGFVRSASERRAATHACWASPGVTAVHDELVDNF